MRNSGILRPEHRDRIKEAYALYRNPRPGQRAKGIAAELFRRTYSHSEIYVDFVGVWDTVGALGIPIDGFRPPWLSRRWTFHDTTLSRYVLNAYHAIAIDERRAAVQADAVGAAGRCGGSDAGAGVVLRRPLRRRRRLPRPRALGDPASVDGREGRGCGLAFKPDHLVVTETGRDPEARRAGISVAPDHGAELHDSRTRFYRLLPAYDRRLAGDEGAEVDGGALASSAKTRHDEDGSYRPPGLSEWLAAGLDITTVQDG